MASNAEKRAWARDNGWPGLSDRGAIPKEVLRAYDAAHLAGIPGPDEPDEDFGEAELEPEEPDWPELGLPPRRPPPMPEEPAEVPADLPPGRLTATPAKGKARGRRPSAAVQQDIAAKVGLMLAIPGKVWEMRDPLCGGTFMRQEPEIAAAFTDIIIDSPDLVEWFTGAGGSFMKWFRLAAACAPVGTMVWAHHVVHSIEPMPEDAQQPPAPDFARFPA